MESSRIELSIDMIYQRLIFINNEITRSPQFHLVEPKTGTTT